MGGKDRQVCDCNSLGVIAHWCFIKEIACAQEVRISNDVSQCRYGISDFILIYDALFNLYKEIVLYKPYSERSCGIVIRNLYLRSYGHCVPTNNVKIIVLGNGEV